MRASLLLVVAAIAVLGLAWTPPARANSCGDTAVLSNCTFPVPSSVKAKDIPGVLRRIVRPLLTDLVDLAKATEAPVVSSDIKDGAVKLRDLSPALQAAVSQAGTPGAQGAPGQALAYARVNADGSIDPSASKDIALVSAANGVYCLRYTAGEPHIITTTVDISAADGRKTIVAGTAVKPAIDGAGACAGETNIEVVTSTATTQTAVAAPFYLVVTV